ncbi:MAG: 50S ribosomal protein L6 [Firmicutes bacterium]|nr:50S ribosomal protein L6 [Bacillota bacterium]
MSRIGKKPIPLPKGVEVTIDGNLVKVKGPKGELQRTIHPSMTVKLEDNTIYVERPTDRKDHRALHGLSRSLIANMIEGVSKGFSKNLEIAGVGYRAAKQGETLVLNVGYSQPVQISPPKGISIDVPAPNKITISGIDKEVVGNLAATIRRVRPPEPYKGKGIKYENERIRRKAGKSGK